MQSDFKDIQLIHKQNVLTQPPCLSFWKTVLTEFTYSIKSPTFIEEWVEATLYITLGLLLENC